VEIISEDIPGWLVSNEGNLTVALEIELTDELLNEGMARELINRIQNIRKESGLEITDRVAVTVASNEQTDKAIAEYADYIKTQVQADELNIGVNDGEAVDFDDFTLNIKVEKI
jgi:isoleucyl-tRNA synthetase